MLLSTSHIKQDNPRLLSNQKNIFMKYTLLTSCFSFLILASFSAFSQQAQWPKTFNTNGSIAKLYEPQPESYQGNILKVRTAVSLLHRDKTDPVFGVLWADVTLKNQGNNLTWQNATVTNIKFPGEATDTELDQLTADLEKQVPSWNIIISKDDLTAKLQNSEKESKLSANLNNNPPKIIYTQQPSILVLIDGQPQFSNNANWGVEQVTNTPFIIVKNTDQQYYLYGNNSWFRASSISGPWSMANQIPSRLKKMDQEVRANDTSKTSNIDNAVANIIVSTEPAELIQSNGEANFSPIQGTNLLYMSNTGNDVFLDVNSQQYYALISGRWFRARNLNNSWTYISADKLPTDFAQIPEGSPKDVVLPNVAGTNAANESVMEAQVPQTAKVDRRNAKASVTYDGDPEFEQIEGTHLKYAINTPGTVLNSGRKYYAVENGVWFESYSAAGPWSVATSRPFEVENIPPSYPVYNSKYVYIYDATPDYVYMGYTPGYLGNYIYGPTIVYGTGYYYKPWRGRHYYPRAYTWGFNMRYNPWTGWNFGIDYWGGWFSCGLDNYYPGNYWGGWWGPQVYRPAYYRSYNYNQGYYGQNVIVNNYTIINNNRSNNLYRYRRDVVTRDRPGFNNVSSNGRSTPYNNDRFNNGRTRPGYNAESGNRGQDQRPGSQFGDRQVNRPYQPDNTQPRRANDRSGFPGNNNNIPGRVAGSDVVPGNRQQPNSNPRIYTPGNNNNRNDGNRNRPGSLMTDRSGNPVTSNPEPQMNRPDIQNRPSNPGIDNLRIPQERPVRIAQDRNLMGPVNNNPRPQIERPYNTMQNRPSDQPSVTPAPRMERRSDQPSVTPAPRMERPSDQPSFPSAPRMERRSDQPSASPAPRTERPSDQPSFPSAPRMERRSDQPPVTPAPRTERPSDQPPVTPAPRMERPSDQPSVSPAPRIERPSRSPL